MPKCLIFIFQLVAESVLASQNARASSLTSESSEAARIVASLPVGDGVALSDSYPAQSSDLSQEDDRTNTKHDALASILVRSCGRLLDMTTSSVNSKPAAAADVSSEHAPAGVSVQGAVQESHQNHSKPKYGYTLC